MGQQVARIDCVGRRADPCRTIIVDVGLCDNQCVLCSIVAEAALYDQAVTGLQRQQTAADSPGLQLQAVSVLAELDQCALTGNTNIIGFAAADQLNGLRGQRGVFHGPVAVIGRVVCLGITVVEINHVDCAGVVIAKTIGTIGSIQSQAARLVGQILQSCLMVGIHGLNKSLQSCAAFWIVVLSDHVGQGAVGSGQCAAVLGDDQGNVIRQVLGIDTVDLYIPQAALGDRGVCDITYFIGVVFAAALSDCEVVADSSLGLK